MKTLRTLCILGLLAGVATVAHAADRPNILFILSEDMGAQLSHPVFAQNATAELQTPNLDALASSGVIFRNTWVSTPVCSASKSGIYTSLHNHTNRIRGNTINLFYPMTKAESDAVTNATYINAQIPAQYPTLIEILRDAGYHTGVTGKLHVAPNYKFPFDDWIAPTNAATVQTMIQNARAASKPWCIWLNPSDAHAPYNKTVMTHIDQSKVQLPATYRSTTTSRNMWARYLSEIERVDTNIGTVMQKVNELGAMDDTIVVFMGDHGPGVPGGKTTPYDMGLRTAMFITGGKNIGIPAGVVSDELFSTIDFMPTLLDLAGIARPALEHGVSHAATLRGSAAPPPRQYMAGECFGGNFGTALMRERSITDGATHLIFRNRINDTRPFNVDMFLEGYGGDNTNGDTYREIVANRAADPDAFEWLARMHSTRFKTHPPQYELYDLAADPWETTDLARDPARRATLNRMHLALRRWALETGDTDTKLPTAIGGETVTDPFEAINVYNDDEAVYPGTKYVKYVVHTGALDADPDWSTLQPGIGGDLTLGGGFLDAPAGDILATQDVLTLMPGQNFTLSAKVQFAGAGVAAGLVFGCLDTQNYYEFQLMDGNTAAGGLNKDARLRRIQNGVASNLLFESTLPNIQPNQWHTLTAAYNAWTHVLTLRIDDPAGAQWFGRTVTLDAPLDPFSRFGLSTWSSNSARFDDWRAQTDDRVQMPGDFNNDGTLDAKDLALLTAAQGADANAHAQFNLALPDDAIDAADAGEWSERLYPAVMGVPWQRSSACAAWAVMP